MVTSIFHLAFWVCRSFVCQAVVWWPQCSVPFPPWLSPLDNFLRDTLPSWGCSHRSFLITRKHCAFRYAGLLSPASFLSSSLSYMFLTIFIWPHFRSLSSEMHRMSPRMVHPSDYHHPRFICITLASPWCAPSLLPQTPPSCETVKSCLLSIRIHTCNKYSIDVTGIEPHGLWLTIGNDVKNISKTISYSTICCH